MLRGALAQSVGVAALLLATPVLGQAPLQPVLSPAFVLRLSRPADAGGPSAPAPQPLAGGEESTATFAPGDSPDQAATASLPPRRPSTFDPYEPLGIRWGGFILYPSISVGVGHTTNAQSTPGGEASTFVTLSPELSLRSDWSRHAATLDLRGGLRHYVDSAADDRPELDVRGSGQVDAGDAWAVPLSAGYTFTTQAVSDPDFPAGVDTPPGVHTLKGSIGIERTGAAVVQAAATVERAIYEDGTSGGLIVDQGDRTNTVFGARLRLGYGVTPSLTPFVEGELVRREFDRPVDNDGVRRSGTLRFLRAGIAVDRAPLLTGEVAFGLGTATFDDPALGAIRAFVVDGDIAWSPTPLTTVTLKAGTMLNPSTNPASSGSALYAASLEAAYAWRRNVTLNAKIAARYEAVEGTGDAETHTTAGVAAVWKLNRMLWLTAGYDHEWLASTVPGRSFESDAVRLEVRAQR